jgi:hypothetical protein
MTEYVSILDSWESSPMLETAGRPAFHYAAHAGRRKLGSCRRNSVVACYRSRPEQVDLDGVAARLGHVRQRVSNQHFIDIVKRR